MFRPIHGHHQVDRNSYYVNELLCGDLNISLCYAVSIGSIGEERANGIKTIRCSGDAGVKYRHGVALVSFFSRDMWVPLWVTGVGSVLPVGQKYKV
jgi:hypothetical protein